jgi:iron(III) transport system ATP-binding protein
MLTVKGLCTEYAGDGKDRQSRVRAADDVTFDVPEGTFFTLLGPSGCGKTTTLRSIAGLERPVSGEIRIGEAVVFSGERRVFVPPNRRNIGMVFQSYAIWPHMNVFENAAFPLKVGSARLSKAAIDERVNRVLAAVGLADFAGREATRLSGGQQQRLALARALVMEPKLLLLDEPLSNLDAKLRQRMRFELKRLQRELGVTTVYVTHDQNEALALSRQIAVMNAGRIVQVGTPREIYESPRPRSGARRRRAVGAPGRPGAGRGTARRRAEPAGRPGAGARVPRRMREHRDPRRRGAPARPRPPVAAHRDRQADFRQPACRKVPRAVTRLNAPKGTFAPQ